MTANLFASGRMPERDYLLTFAEISVALAGFSSLVALLGSRRGASHPELDVARLLTMLEASLFVALMCVVPLLPHALGASEEMAWRLSAAVFLTVDAAATYVAGQRWKRVSRHFERQDRLLQPRGYFPSSCFELTEDLLSDPKRERRS